ncbi:MAG: 3-deoxy-manno-octulosonate cytidylyltransferase [Bacteroidetes bacterium]|nr:3-deoxy-manno-octulosonate cytidylyltransferase [Bacteroidota bacterium]
MKKDLIVIPARYNSKRLPGKPLILINDIPLLDRVVSIAMQVKCQVDNIDVLVATDSLDIAEHCKKIKVNFIMTESNVASGTERVYLACKELSYLPNFIINLQGDAPFVNPSQVVSLINKARNNNSNVTTTAYQLSWQNLDTLRERKKSSPFSGTTCTIDNLDYAIWFTKQIIPSIRNEETVRLKNPKSPVYQHLGLYCFKFDALRKFFQFKAGRYEELEELEQLRFIENGIKILVDIVEETNFSMSGIDSPNDVIVATQILKKFKDPFVEWDN